MSETRTFLRDLIAREVFVRVFLINGVKLDGIIAARCDEGHILLVRNGHKQMVYKHAISTISEERKYEGPNSIVLYGADPK